MEKSWIERMVEEFNGSGFATMRMVRLVNEIYTGDWSPQVKMNFYKELKMSVIPSLPKSYAERGKEVIGNVETHLKGILKEDVLKVYDRAGDKSLFLRAIYDSSKRM